MITSSSFAKTLWPGVNKFWEAKEKMHEKHYLKIFDFYTSKKGAEEDVAMSGLGLPSVKPEAQAITMDTMQQTYVTRYVMVTYGLGISISKEAVDDDQYGVHAQKKGTALSNAMNLGRETVCALILDRAFNSSYTFGDGKEMCATDHPILGGTFANELTTAADLSEASLEQALIDIGKMPNERGQRIHTMGKKLVIPVDLQFEALRILNSVGRVGTANNDLNAIARSGSLSEGIVINPYLTDTDAWFIKTDADDGLKFWERWKPEVLIDNDSSTLNAKFLGVDRFAAGVSNPRAIFGSPGA